MEARMEAAIAAGVGAHPTATGAKRPQLPNNFFKFPAPARLKAVQQYISSFEYKQSPHTSFNSHKFRPLSRIMDTAKMMIYSPQPIKCVEAVFLALYLTAGMHDVDRIPLSFKTQEDSKVHQHIVLLVRYCGKYGAFGISRRPELMNKEFEFDSITSIVENYKRAYEAYQHTVLKIRIGLPVEHNAESYNFICWRYLTVAPCSKPWVECCEEMEKHVVHSKRLWEKWLVEGQGGAAKTSTLKSDPKSVKKEDDNSVKVKSVTAQYTKQTNAYVTKELRRPPSRTRMFKLARADNSGTGKINICSVQREGKKSLKGRSLRSRQFSLAAKTKLKSSNRKFALKGRTVELVSSIEDELVTHVVKKRQLSGKIMRNRPGKVPLPRKVCSVVPCRLDLSDFQALAKTQVCA